MASKPKLSVITIVYNDHKGLELTANSIISQRALSDTEWIIIDADSQDGTKDVIEKYKKFAAHSISEPDKGRYDGMNKGIALAKGEYTIFMNAGDTFADNSVIENILKESSWKDADYISGNTYEIMNNKITGRNLSPDTLTAKFFLKDALCHQSTFIKTERLKRYGGYDYEYPITADAKFFFEDIVLRDAKYAKTDIFISRYDTSGISSCNTNAVQQEKMRYISALLPPRVIKDIQKLTFGETALERIMTKLNPKGGLYYIISIFAIIIYSPIAIRNRLRMRLKSSK